MLWLGEKVRFLYLSAINWSSVSGKLRLVREQLKVQS